MSGRVKRYVPSFKRRKLDGRRESTFLDDAGTDLETTPTENNGKDMPSTTNAGVSSQSTSRTDNTVGLRHRLRHLAKRDGEDEAPRLDGVPEIIDGVVENVGNVGVTVTVSIGVSFQVSTISSGGSTIVSVGTTWFTLDSTGGISVPAIPTTPPSITTPEGLLPTNPTSGDASLTAQPATVGLPSSPSSISTTTQTSSTPSPTDNAFFQPLTTITSTYQTYGPNMTAYYSIGGSRTSTRDRTVIVYSEVSPSRTSSQGSSSFRSQSSTSTASSTTTYPAGGAYPLPQSPTPTLNPDSETDTGGETPITERLPPILGGVFGGLAGVALVLWALLFFLRKRRRSAIGNSGFLGVSPGGRHQRALSQETGPGSMGEVQHPGGSGLPGFLTASFFGRSSGSPPPPTSERGFVKISGRKLPSMYGDDMVPTSMAVASARASVSEPGSRNVSGGTHPTMGGSLHQEDDQLVHAPIPFQPGSARSAMRTSSPALTSRIAEHETGTDTTVHSHPLPQINDPAEGSSRFPTPPPGVVRRMHSSIGADGVGRSLASQDGSKTSRFTEDV